MTKLFVALLIIVSFNAFAMRNGKKMKHVSSPSLVHLQIGQGTCSGVRISKSFILTAAHCFKKNPKKFTIRYINGSKIIIEKIHYSDVIIKGTDLSEELAIVPINAPELPEDQVITTFPIYPYEPNHFFLTDEFTIAGFGMNQSGSIGTLKEGQVTFKQDYRRSANPDLQMLVVQPKKSNDFPCPGDSGGPIFSYKGGEKSLVGIVSFIASSKVNLQNYEPQEQCRLANLASYIPISMHMDFLQRFLD